MRVTCARCLMSSVMFFLSTEQRAVLVFPVIPSCSYRLRLFFAFGCIGSGALLQYYDTYPSIFSCLLILSGNLLLLVKGCDNRINMGKFAAAADWEQVTESKIAEIEALVKQMKRWDRHPLDVSNWLGGGLLLVVLLGLAGAFFFGLVSEQMVIVILAVDAFLLAFPQWVIGTRDIETQPNLLFKIAHLKRLLAEKEVARALETHEVEYFLLLKGDTQKIPDDVKIRIKLAQAHPDFLGYYGQIVINHIGEQKYPYFYVVIVAKKGYGLKYYFDAYAPPANVTKELTAQTDVEVIIIRQSTTRTSGYQTKTKQMRRLLLDGLAVAAEAARREAVVEQHP